MTVPRNLRGEPTAGDALAIVEATMQGGGPRVDAITGLREAYPATALDVVIRAVDAAYAALADRGNSVAQVEVARQARLEKNYAAYMAGEKK